MDLMHCGQRLKAQGCNALFTLALLMSVISWTFASAHPHKANPIAHGNASVGQPTPIAQTAISAVTAPAASPTVMTAPLVVKIDPGATLQLKGDEPSFTTKYIVPFIGPAISGLLAMGGILLSVRFAQRNNEMTIWQKANEAELKDLMAKLDGFYGPFMQMSQANHLMSEEFKSRQKSGFRTLVAVFSQDWLNSLEIGDREVIAQVCGNAEILEKFIFEKTGMVDIKILPYLARVSAHFRILSLAYQGKLGRDHTNFEKYVYPQQLDHVIKLEINRIQARCGALRAKPGISHPPMETLVIPTNLELEKWPAASGRII